MDIRLLTTPAHHYGEGWPAVGEVVAVPDGLGAYMVARGEAEEVEAAVARTSRPKPKKR